GTVSDTAPSAGAMMTGAASPLWVFGLGLGLGLAEAGAARTSGAVRTRSAHAWPRRRRSDMPLTLTGNCRPCPPAWGIWRAGHRSDSEPGPAQTSYTVAGAAALNTIA